MASPSQPPSVGPPYPAAIQLVGGAPPIPYIDSPISGVFLGMFVCLGIFHMTTLQINLRRGHKFVFSGLMFGLSVARTAAMSVRIAWAANPTNPSLALAANILTQAGVVILFIANLFFTQRIVRATHPKLGWSLPGRIVFRLIFGGVFAALVMLIICVVHMSFTLDRIAQNMDRKVQLTGGTYFLFVAFLPLPVVSLAAWLRDRNNSPIEKFGSGRFRHQVALLLFTSTLLTLGAGFRLGTNFAATPVGDIRWWHHKACYYVLNFGVEIICSMTYAAARFDRRFHIPNGAKAAGDYSRGNLMEETEEMDEEAKKIELEQQNHSFGGGRLTTNLDEILEEDLDLGRIAMMIMDEEQGHEKESNNNNNNNPAAAPTSWDDEVTVANMSNSNMSNEKLDLKDDAKADAKDDKKDDTKDEIKEDTTEDDAKEDGKEEIFEDAK